MKSVKRNVLALLVSGIFMCSAWAHANWEPYLSVFAAIRDTSQTVYLKERLEKVSAIKTAIVDPGAFLFKAAQLGNLAAIATILSHFADLLSEKDIESACRIAMHNQHFAVFAALLDLRRLSQATLTALMVRAIEDDRIKAAKLCLLSGAQMNQIVRCQSGPILEGQRYATTSGAALVKRHSLEYVFSQLPANSDEVLGEENPDIVSETLNAQDRRDSTLLKARLLDLNWHTLDLRRLNFDTNWVSIHLFIRALYGNDNDTASLLNSLEHLKANESLANLASCDDTKRGLLNQLSRAVQIGNLEKVRESVNSLGEATLDQPTKNAMVMLAAHQGHNNIVFFLLNNFTLESNAKLSQLAANLNYSGLKIVKPYGSRWIDATLRDGKELRHVLHQIELFGQKKQDLITSVVAANDWELFLQLFPFSEEELSAGMVAAVRYNRLRMFSICLNKKRELWSNDSRWILANIFDHVAIECMCQLMARFPCLSSFPSVERPRSKAMRALYFAYRARSAVKDSYRRSWALHDAVDSGRPELVEETLNHPQLAFDQRQVLIALVRAGLAQRERIFSRLLVAFFERLTPDEQVRLPRPPAFAQATQRSKRHLTEISAKDLPKYALNVLFAFAKTLGFGDRWIVRQAARTINSSDAISQIIKMSTSRLLPDELGKALRSAAKHSHDQAFQSLLPLVNSVEPSSFSEFLLNLDKLDLRWTQLLTKQYGNIDFPIKFLGNLAESLRQHILRYAVSNAIARDQLSYPEDVLDAAISLGDAELLKQLLNRHPMSISRWPCAIGYAGLNNMAIMGTIFDRVQPSDRVPLLLSLAYMRATDAVWLFMERFPHLDLDQLNPNDIDDQQMRNLLRAYRACNAPAAQAPAPAPAPVLRLSALL